MQQTITLARPKLQSKDEKQPETLGGLLSYSAQQFGAETALIADNNHYSYVQLDHMAAQLANALKNQGVRTGDRVSLLAENSAVWLVCYHGVLRLGAVINPLNIMLTAEEVEFALTDCGSKALMASGSKLLALKDSSLLSSLKIVVSLDETGSENAINFEEFIAGQSETFTPIQVSAKSLSTICYTSGTTGRPKGVMQSHESVLFNTTMTAYMHARSHGDVVVSALPCPHVYGNVVNNSALLNGLTVIMHRRFDEQGVLGSIERYSATIFEGVPAMYMMLLNHPDLNNTDLSSLRLCTVGGQTMPVAKMKSVVELFNCPLVELWGMTEIAGLGTTFYTDSDARMGSIGLPLPGVDARIANTEDASITLPAGELGELMIRGPIVMMGYFNNDVATCETIEADGWLHSGDIAYIDEQGYIFIVDRKKDMILTGGYNIYPAEIERVISTHPGVAMVAVGSIPDEIKGEVPKAYVVLKQGVTTEFSAVIAYCRQYLAAYKIPRQIQFVEDLPKTSTGKIMRRALHSLDND